MSTYLQDVGTFDQDPETLIKLMDYVYPEPGKSKKLPAGFKISNKLSNNTYGQQNWLGASMIVVEKNDQVFVLVAGTDQVIDVASYPTGTPQFETLRPQMEAAIRYAKEKNKKIAFGGHSLGGMVVQEAQRVYGVPIFTYNTKKVDMTKLLSFSSKQYQSNTFYGYSALGDVKPYWLSIETIGEPLSGLFDPISASRRIYEIRDSILSLGNHGTAMSEYDGKRIFIDHNTWYTKWNESTKNLLGTHLVGVVDNRDLSENARYQDSVSTTLENRFGAQRTTEISGDDLKQYDLTMAIINGGMAIDLRTKARDSINNLPKFLYSNDNRQNLEISLSLDHGTLFDTENLQDNSVDFYFKKSGGEISRFSLNDSEEIRKMDLENSIIEGNLGGNNTKVWGRSGYDSATFSRIGRDGQRYYLLGDQEFPFGHPTLAGKTFDHTGNPDYEETLSHDNIDYNSLKESPSSTYDLINNSDIYPDMMRSVIPDDPNNQKYYKLDFTNGGPLFIPGKYKGWRPGDIPYKEILFEIPGDYDYKNSEVIMTNLDSWDALKYLNIPTWTFEGND